MSKKPTYYTGSIPVFIGEDYFLPGENVFIQMSNENKDFIGVPHKHTFIEIVYVISGSATHVTSLSRYKVKKGDLVIVNHETVHAFYPEEDEKEFVTYDLMFLADFFNVNAKSNDLFDIVTSSFLFYSISQVDRPQSDLHFDDLGFIEIGEIFNKIYREFKQRDRGFIAMIRAYTIELMIRIFRKIDDTPREGAVNKQSQLINAALIHLHENYRDPIRVEELAAQNYVSKEYFGRMFKNITGMSISAMLQKIRIDEACALLITSDRIITDIAESCGFNDIKYFYETFRKHTGMTPGDYRKAKYGQMITFQKPEKDS